MAINVAKIGIDNKVLSIISMDNIEFLDRDGIYDENIGIKKLILTHGHESWVAVNGSRGVCGLDWIYNSEHDIFHPPIPTDMNGEKCLSWTLNTTTCQWEPPIERPQETEQEYLVGKKYVWNEDAYQADNTTGWVLQIP